MQVLRKHSASLMIRIGYNLHVPSILKSIYLTGKDGLRLLEHFPCCGMRVASMLQGDDFENTIKKRIACLAIPLTVVRLSALLTRSSMSLEALNKPAFIPVGMAVSGRLGDPVCPDGDCHLSSGSGIAQPDCFNCLQRPAPF